MFIKLGIVSTRWEAEFHPVAIALTLTLNMFFYNVFVIDNLLLLCNNNNNLLYIMYNNNVYSLLLCN